MATPMIGRTAETDIIQAELVPMSEVPNSLIASAVQIRPNDTLWSTYKFSAETWQPQAWRYYHSTPELHFICEYIASACSRIRLYVAEVDANGRVGAEVETAEIQAIGDTLFGDPAAKAEALRSIAINLTIAGECYIIGRARRGDFDPDQWFIASTTELRRRQGAITINLGTGVEKLIPGTDIVIRLWNPNPERRMYPDSPTAACFEPLSELEQLQLFERSQIDSRLAGAGMYPIPAGATNGPSDPSSASLADDLFTKMAEAGQAARTGQGVAAGVVPVFVEFPEESIQHLKDRPIRFDSELSDKLVEYKEGAIRRLARGMNIPPEVLTGMGDTNHLSAWKIEEDFIKIQIEPMVSRICDGLNRAYLRPLLKAMGKNPDSYTLQYDTAPLTVRPNRLQDTLNLYERGIVSAEAVLVAGSYNPNTDAPSEEEEQLRFLRELLLRDPTLFQIPAIREELGYDLEITMPGPDVPAGDVMEPGPPAPPTPTRRVDSPTTPAQIPGQTRSTGGTPILASGVLTRAPDVILAAANVAVRRALELAGGKLLTRDMRGRFPDTPKFEMHTKVSTKGEAEADMLLSGAFDYLALDMAAIDVPLPKLQRALHHYCVGLIRSSRPHDIDNLRRYLELYGVACV